MEDLAQSEMSHPAHSKLLHVMILQQHVPN